MRACYGIREVSSWPLLLLLFLVHHAGTTPVLDHGPGLSYTVRLKGTLLGGRVPLDADLGLNQPRAISHFDYTKKMGYGITCCPVDDDYGRRGNGPDAPNNPQNRKTGAFRQALAGCADRSIHSNTPFRCQDTLE